MFICHNFFHEEIMKYKLFLLVALLVVTSNLKAQVGGISASKLGSFNTETVSKHTIELEPTFSFSFAKKEWNRDSKLVNIYTNGDSIVKESELGFRMTYGLTNDLEIGVNFLSDAENLSVGLKYNIPLKMKKMSLGLIGGTNIPLGNKSYNPKDELAENTTQIALGGVMSYEFNDRNSLDVNLSYQDYFKKTTNKHKNDLFFTADFGHYLKQKNILLITGLVYSYSRFDNNDLNVYLLTANIGVSLEYAKNFLVILNMPVDLAGKNMHKTIGGSIALTIMFD